jgi:hypothetical protein
MTQLEVEYNKLQETNRSNLANEEIKSRQATSAAKQAEAALSQAETASRRADTAQYDAETSRAQQQVNAYLAKEKTINDAATQVNNWYSANKNFVGKILGGLL